MASLQPQAPGTQLQHGADAGGAALANIAERGGFLPKPEQFDERLKPGFRGGKALFVFFLCNAVPFGALLYYLREQRMQRTQLSLIALPTTADDVAAEALRVVRTASVCFLTQAGTAGGSMLRVDPHPPEGTAYVPPTKPLALLPQVERNVITDIFESPSVPGLGFIHFAISRTAASAAPILAGDRRASLLYVSNSREAYCNITGQLSVLGDVESRRHYWRGSWAASFLPCEARPTEPGKEAPPAWAHSDYLLLRLAVSEVALQATVDGPMRWEERRVRARDASPQDGASSSRWALVVPDAPRT